jgi:hypothetical protein
MHKKKRLATFGAGGFALLREIDVTWCLCLFTPSPNICNQTFNQTFFLVFLVLCPNIINIPGLIHEAALMRRVGL